MIRSFRKTFLAMLGLLIFALPCCAQIKLGEGVALSHADGTLGAGYNAGFGNLMSGSHSLDLSGTGSVSGYYFDPKFISFTATPYYGESRANSNYQSISDSKGIGLSSSFFGSTHLPGAVNYSKDYDSLGSFSVPGLPNFTTKTNSETVGVSWGETVPGLPSLTTNFQHGNSNYSVYGATGQGQSTSQSAGLYSSYLIDGFNMNGTFTRSTSNSSTPNVLNGGIAQSSSSGGDSYSFSAGHNLPLNGQGSASFNHSNTTYQSPSNDSSGNLSYESIASSGSLRPWQKVNIAVTANYTNNLGGETNQQIIASGATLENTSHLPPSDALSLQSTITYRVNMNLSTSGEIERRIQSWQGSSYAATYYSGYGVYSRDIPHGNFSVSSSITEATQDGSSQNTLGSSTSASIARRFGPWSISTSAGYTQNVQTLLITYSTSNYNFAGSAQRRLGLFYWSVGASTARSGLALVSGDSNSNESFSTSLSARRWFSLNGSYQKSKGEAFLGSQGITQAQVITPIVSSTPLYLFNGDSYSVSLSTSAIKHFSAAASFSKSLNNTVGASTTSKNSNEQALFTTQYQMRKIYLVGGYTRFNQGFSSVGNSASVASSFYIGITRWFKAF